MTHAPHHHRRAFTLLELTLAIAIGSIVVVSAVGLLTGIARVDAAQTARARAATEFEVTHATVRRTFLNLRLEAGAATEGPGVRDDAPAPTGRARIILGPDAAASSSSAPAPDLQSLELVLDRWPVPGGLMSRATDWAFADDDEASLNFSSSDGSGGAARAVFELRHDGQREAVLNRLGIASPWLTSEDPTTADSARAPGYTLWIRRMPKAELDALARGEGPFLDGQGDPEFEARRLASAVRLARGLTQARWTIFRNAQRRTAFVGRTQGDTPAYAELELRTADGRFENWLFEISFVTGADPSTSGGGSAGEDADGDGVPDEPTDEPTDDAGTNDQSGNGSGNGSGSGSGSGSGGRPVTDIPDPIVIPSGRPRP